MALDPKGRPLVVRRYRDIELAHGMSVVDGVYGQILVIARYKGKSQRREFPLSSPLSERLMWQHQMMEQMRLASMRRPPKDTTLAEDIDRYVLSLPEGDKQEYARQWLSYWRLWYGHLKREDLSLQDCQAFFEYVKPKSNPEGEFSGSSKNHLRSCLLSVYRYLDGRAHTCPLRDVPLFAESKPQPREVSPAHVQAILAAMSDCPNRARLAMLWVTGCRPEELTSMTPDAFQLAETPAYVWVRGAKGGNDRMVPLPAFALPYAQDFLRHQAWKRQSSALLKTMLAAAKRAGVVIETGERHPGGRKKLKLTPYSLRHAYAMNLRRAGAGIQDIADQLGHASLQTTRRYAQAIPEQQAVLTERMWGRAVLTGAKTETVQTVSNTPE